MELKPTYLFVVWHRGMPELDKVLSLLGRRFRILQQFEISWPRKHYIRNFAAFYGWKNYFMWRSKRAHVGAGPFRVIVVQDDQPKFTQDAANPALMNNENMLQIKATLRHTMRHSNVIHASVNEAETRHNLRALTGQSLEEFLSRTDLDGAVKKLDMPNPMSFVPYPYANEKFVGSKFFEFRACAKNACVLLLPRCGLPTILSFSIRFFGVFSFAFCLGAIKFWMPQATNKT